MSKMNFSLVTLFLVTVHVSLNTVGAQELMADLLFYEMPESCAVKGLSYCFEKGTDYPEEKIKELLKKMPVLESDDTEIPASFDDRKGDTYDEPDCPSSSTKKPIYYIIDKEDRVRVVVQSPKRFEQIYTVTWCLNEGLIENDTPHFVKNTTLKKFNIECVSSTLDMDFYVLNEELGLKMEVVKAKNGIPVCCKCRYNAKNK